jgi:hypothetical protein
VDNDADMNLQGGEFGSTLQAASFGGHLDIVKLLVDRGANVNVEGGRFGDALRAASFGSDAFEIVKLLLGDELVELLVEQGDDSEEYWHAKFRAASRGGLEMVKLLVEQGCQRERTGCRLRQFARGSA